MSQSQRWTPSAGAVLSGLFLLLSGPSIRAHEGYDQALKSLCESNGRVAPLGLEDCSSCHVSPSGGGARNASGKIYETGDKTRILNFFCADEANTASSVRYNQKADGALPPVWLPSTTPAEAYAGSLEAYWSVVLESDLESQTISSQRAKALGAGPLLASPDNCWGHAMNFGWVTLAKDATLTLSMTGEEGVDLIPGFALYQGVDSGQSASRDETILFGNPPSNPLGTSGLNFVGDRLGDRPGGTVTASWNLRAGRYTVFVTVGSNQSHSGGYRLNLRSSPFGNGDGEIRTAGVCGSANNSPLTQAANLSPDALCENGKPGPVLKASANRLSWSCLGTEALSANAQCYSASSNGKTNQPPLTLMPGSIELPSGGLVNEIAEGGRSGAAVSYRLVKPQPKGVTCTLKQKGSKATVTGRGKGTCELYGTKPGDKTHNDVRSGPVFLFVSPD